MNNERYLFRGKCLDNNEWVEGSLVIFKLDTEMGIREGYKISDITYGEFPGNYYMSGLEESVNADTVGQYTGLRDKHNKRIFEGDIVRVHDTLLRSDEPHHEFTGYVDFSDASFCIVDCDETCRHYRWMDYECQVIGNKWDNPELLEG